MSPRRPGAYCGVQQDGKSSWYAKIGHLRHSRNLGQFPSAAAAAKAYDRCVPNESSCIAVDSLTLGRLCSAAYKLRGDSSGPNCGPLSVAEKAEVDGATEAELFPPARKKSSSYKGVTVRLKTSVKCVPVQLGGMLQLY
jgi:hypothetical protein